MRTDLRELAKLAAPESSPAPHAFETADSSGYVDLSAFSASDDSWVERELARAGGRTKAGTVLAAGSMAPVAMSSLLGPEPVDADRPPRKRGWAYTVLGLAGTAVVAALAVAVARHAPPAKGGAQVQLSQPAVAPAAPTLTVAPATAAPGTATPAPAAIASAPAPVEVTVVAASPAPASSKKHAGAHWRVTAAPASPVAVAARPAQPPPAKVTIPAPKSGGGGGDSLMDLMRASINSPKK